jgi:mono/diheme cytochrome c family protein
MRLFLIASAVLWYTAAASAAPIDYARDIRPLLKERCFACHGALKQEGELRLDTASLIGKGGSSGSAIVVGDAGGSQLIERVSAKDEAERMPPEGAPLSPEQIQLLSAWIDQGAKAPQDEVPEEDPRKHWSFQPLTRPVVPAMNNGDSIRNEIDAFINAEHDKHGLQPMPPAEKHTLLRRVYLDLIGLPPTRDELQAFLADDSPDAYESVVNRLLDSPQYGERWGRHWMDVWRFSDWYGRRYVPDVWNSAPQVWRWRDWIVRSLNDNHGYDRMLQEMLAADEIAPEDDEAGYATGYLIRNWYALNPNDWMRSTVEHTGKAFLGLTFNCAHCHDHKYDPIAHDDYFRLRAFFEPIYIRQDRVPGEADPGPFQDYDYGQLRKIQQLGAVRAFDKTPDAITWFYTGGDERNRVTDRGSIPPGVPEFLSASLPKIEPVELPPRAWYPGLRPAIQQTVIDAAMDAIAEAERAVLAAKQSDTTSSQTGHGQRAIAEAQEIAARAELASIEARIAADRAKYGETPEADVAALTLAASRLEREAALRRSEAEVILQERTLAEAEAKPADDAKRAEAIGAATKALAATKSARDQARHALSDASRDGVYTAFSPTYPQTSTGRRKALAEWITSRDNPLTARVAVNHIWMRHFHIPLVGSVNDFGRNGDSPTHPELLDWLAVELMDSGWNMKHLHRLIVSSAAYRRVSAAKDAAQWIAIDPENRLLWRMNAGRMESEVIRDSLLYCAGQLDRTMGGQPIENSDSLTTHRRSLYYSFYPEQGGTSPLGELFDGPNPLDCYRRTRSIIPQQALAMTNSELVHQVSAAIVGNWKAAEEGQGAELFVVEMFKQILSRTPSNIERQVCVDAFETQHALLLQSSGDEVVATRGARESVVRALFSHNDFVTIR